MVGLGVTGMAVGRALARRGSTVLAVDDRPQEAHRRFADEVGVTLTETPDAATLERLLGAVEVLLPSPGVPDRHPVFALAEAAGVPVRSEFDLAAAWDDRPIVAVTGTNGKTTVTHLTADMLRRDGRVVAEAGNVDTPLVEAIDDPAVEMFVVEASSFRLGHTGHWAPEVAAWLNFAPDHLDVHADLAHYEAAKARIWADQGPDAVAVVNADDPVVSAHRGRARRRTFGFSGAETATVRDGYLVVDDRPLIAVADLRRGLRHDQANALAAALMAGAVGAGDEAVTTALAAFDGLPHRVQLVGERAGVRWYDDTKATTPQQGHRPARPAWNGRHGAGRHRDRRSRRRGRGRRRRTRPAPAGGIDGRCGQRSRRSRAPRRRNRALARLCFLRLVLVLRRAGRRLRPSRPHPSRPRGGPAMSPTTSAQTGRSRTAHPAVAGRRRPAHDPGAARGRHPSARPGPKRPPGDRSSTFVGLLVVVTALVLLGLVMVMSAASVSDLRTSGSAWDSFTRQAVFALVGVVGMFVVMHQHYGLWRRLATPFLVVSFVLLALVLVPGVGVGANGATRWLGAGSLRIQPSELAKLAMIIWSARWLAEDSHREALRDDPRVLRPVLLALGAIAVLLLLQPNLGTLIITAGAVGAVVFVSGASLTRLAGWGAVGVTAACVAALSADYRRARLLGFLHPWDDPANTGYQTIQSLVGIAGGGITGVGLGASRAKWGFLPYAHTDFIFAIIAEELGLIGALTVLSLFVALGYFGVRAALRAPDTFGMLLAAGITTWFVLQALVNIGAVVGLLPITGVPLPFVSYGGTSLVVNLLAMGVLLSVARHGRDA